MITFRAPEDIDTLLTKAERATGSTRTELIIAAVRASLPLVVEELDNERSRMARQFVAEEAKRVSPSSTKVGDIARQLAKQAVKRIQEEHEAEAAAAAPSVQENPPKRTGRRKT